MAIPETTSSVKELVEIGIDGFKFIKNTLGKDYQMFATKYNFALQEYFDAKIKTLGKIKQAFFTSKVVNFHDVYVPQNLTFSKQVLSQDDFLKKIKEDKRFVISATAGAGKSCMMKNLFLTIIKNEKPFFPLFFELRRVNNQHLSIIDSLVADIAQYNSKFGTENLEYILKRDNTILLLDGFDELNHDKKNHYTREVNQLSELYPDLNIVISSRPEYGLFREWSLYNVAHVQNLDINQAEQVIKKINYDSELSERFISALKNELFESHKSFMCNPLLLTIMLSTYEQCGEIPKRKHLFYKKAFDAIFHKHDVYKNGFLRKKFTNLDEEDFQNFFSMFCIGTYLKSKYSFDESLLDEYLEKCLLKYNFNDITAENLRQDLLVSVPLLMKDGTEYTFTHRSFQEYFTAIYIVNNQSINIEILKKVLKKDNYNDVLKMVYDLNVDVIENRLILPIINDFIEDVEKNKYSKIEVLAKFFPKIVCEDRWDFHEESWMTSSVFDIIKLVYMLNYSMVNENREAIKSFLDINAKSRVIEYAGVYPRTEYDFLDFYKNNELQELSMVNHIIDIVRNIQKEISVKSQNCNNIFNELIGF